MLLDQHAEGLGGDPLVSVFGETELERMRVSLQRRLFHEASTASVLLGRFEIQSVLGRGGMGTVYAGFDPQLRRTVALKVMRPHHRGTHALRRMVREARALAMLHHPNVVEVFDVGTAGEEFFIAMEYVEGPTLRQWLSEQRPSRHEIVDVFLAVGRGLAAAHAAGVVHRDFKPDNVILGRDGRARVVDFGLADAPYRVWPTLETSSSLSVGSGQEEGVRLDLDDPESATTGDYLAGTPGYMAPEQLANKRADARADQYAFCICLVEALTGERPWPGEDRSDLLAQMRRHHRPSLRRGRLPRRVVAVLERGLSLKPEDRYPDLSALLDALDHVRRPRPILVASAAALASMALVLGGWHVARPEPLPVGCDRPSAAPVPWADWNERWDAAFSVACADGVPPPRRAAILGCLDVRAREAAAVLELLGGTRPEQRGIHLPAPDACVRAEAPLSEAAQRLQIDRARHQAALASGRIATAVRVGEEALERARLRGERALESEIAFGLGGIAAAAGRVGEAERLLRAAYFAAVELEADERAARVAASLVEVVASQPSRHEVALRWRDQASRHLERAYGQGADTAHFAVLLAQTELSLAQGQLDDAEARLDALPSELPNRGLDRELGRARAHWARGRLLARRGQLVEAERELVEAVGRARATFGRDHIGVAPFELAWGEVLRDRGELEAAAAVLGRLVERLRDAYGDAPRTGEAELALAEVRLRQRQPAQARRLAQSAIAIAVATGDGGGDRLRAQASSLLGRLDLYVGDPSSAAVRLRAAIEAGSPEARSDRARLAIVLRQQGRLSEGWQLAQEVEALAREADDARAATLSAAARGLMLHDQRRWAEAVDPLERALARALPEEPWLQAEVPFALATALMAEGSPGAEARALPLARQAAASFRAAGRVDRAVDVERFLAGLPTR